MLSRCLRVLIFTSFSFEYYLTSFFLSSRLSFSSVTVWGMAVVCMNICTYVYVYEERYMHVCKRKEEFLKITVTSSTQDSNPSKSDQNEKRVTPLPLPSPAEARAPAPIAQGCQPDLPRVIPSPQK